MLLSLFYVVQINGVPQYELQLYFKASRLEKDLNKNGPLHSISLGTNSIVSMGLVAEKNENEKEREREKLLFNSNCAENAPSFRLSVC